MHDVAGPLSVVQSAPTRANAPMGCSATARRPVSVTSASQAHPLAARWLVTRELTSAVSRPRALEDGAHPFRPAANCTTDADCSDGLYCNGEELCLAGSCASAATTPCGTFDCDEEANQCREWKLAARTFGVICSLARQSRVQQAARPLSPSLALSLSAMWTTTRRAPTVPPVEVP